MCADGHEVLVECQDRGIDVHNAGVYCSGLLVGGDTYFYSPAPEEMKARAAGWGALAKDYSVPLQSVAIAFGMLPATVSHVPIGMRSEAEVLQSIAWAEAKVPGALWDDASERGLLPDEAVAAFAAVRE